MRVTDLILEFSQPPSPDDELDQQLDQKSREIEQDAEPDVPEPDAQLSNSPATADTVASSQPGINKSTSIGQNLEPELFSPQTIATPVESTPEFQEALPRLTQLWTSANKLPEDNIVRNFVFKLFQTLASLSYANELRESGEVLGTKEHLIYRAGLALAGQFDDPDIRTKIEAMLSKTETLVAIANDPGVKKAFIRHDTSTRLSVEEKFVKRDAKLEALAQQKSADLGMPIRWARNLIGMFGTATEMTINSNAREAFLEACANDTALDLKSMMQAKQGKIEDFVLNQPPEIKQVFKAIKSTLLDISLSTGQGAATGPFEALLAIMGGAKKAATGDLLINGKKYEVKSCSISIKETTTKKNGTSLAGGNSNAWLDASSEIAPSAARNIFAGVIKSKGISPSILSDDADFRPGMQALSGPLSHMANFLSNKNVVASAKDIIYDFHATLYPDIVKLPLSIYNFRTACNRILAGIYSLKAEDVAKEQGIMAMLQYRMGAYESGFVLYNSSTQTFRVIDEPQDIVALLKEKGTGGDYQVNFQKSTITIAKKSSGRKSAPGIYFGPSANSPAGEKYIDNKRAERGFDKKLKAGAKSQTAWENGLDSAPYLPDGKMKASKSRSDKTQALNEVDDFLFNL